MHDFEAAMNLRTNGGVYKRRMFINKSAKFQNPPEISQPKLFTSSWSLVGSRCEQMEITELKIQSVAWNFLAHRIGWISPR